MNILPLASDRLSLEFGPAELDAVLAGLRKHGRLRREARASYDLLSVAGEQFVLMNDWGEPCLIAKTANGDAMLRELAGATADRPDLRRAAG